MKTTAEKTTAAERKKIKEMIRRSIEDSERWRGGLGIGETERSASGVTPDSGHRRVDKAEPETCSETWQDGKLCRIVGYIPLSRGSNSRLSSGRNHG